MRQKAGQRPGGKTLLEKFSGGMHTAKCRSCHCLRGALKVKRLCLSFAKKGAGNMRPVIREKRE
jgi:hypothetical protein